MPPPDPLASWGCGSGATLARACGGCSTPPRPPRLLLSPGLSSLLTALPLGSAGLPSLSVAPLNLCAGPAGAWAAARGGLRLEGRRQSSQSLSLTTLGLPRPAGWLPPGQVCTPRQRVGAAAPRRQGQARPHDLGGSFSAASPTCECLKEGTRSVFLVEVPGGAGPLDDGRLSFCAPWVLQRWLRSCGHHRHRWSLRAGPGPQPLC